MLIGYGNVRYREQTLPAEYLKERHKESPRKASVNRLSDR
jgi:hypothetical protein